MFFSIVEILGNGGGYMKNRLIKLVEKDGFILFLFLCVCVVAGGTLFLSMRNLKGNHDRGNVDFIILEDMENRDPSYDEEMALINESDMEIGVTNLDEEEVVEATVEDYEEMEEDIEFEEEEMEDSQLVEDAKTLILPLEGPIITDYTSNSLVYSETLEAWIGHGAVDIGSKEGTPVRAAMDGVIKEVYEDELWGIVVVIDHGNQLETRYSNLSTKEMVKEGLKVKRGDHISKVGNTAKVEMLMEPHIHFEVIKNGKLVDPRSIIK